MPRRTPAQRATASIARVLKQLEAARAKVKELEAQVAEMSAALIGAVGKPQAKQQWPADLLALGRPAAPDPEPEPSGPAAELAPQDNQGDGRWI